MSKNNKNKVARTLYFQILFLIIALTAMVIISSVYASSIVKSQVELLGNQTMENAMVEIDSILKDSESTLENIVFSCKQIIENNGNQVEILDLFQEYTHWLSIKSPTFDDESGVYGLIKGEFLDGTGWVPPPEYDAKQRPWYFGAMETPGTTFVSEPYVNAQTNKVTITFSKSVHDKGGNFFGVISFDIDITNFSKEISALRLNGEGYGILLSRNFTVMSHKESKYVGIKMDDLNSEFKDLIFLKNKLDESKNISGLHFTDYNELKSVGFFREIFRGWVVGIISPTDSYYSTATKMVLSVSAIGFVLMCVSTYMLIFMSRKNIKYMMELETSTHKVKKFKNLADTDALTGIRNRNSYNEIISKYEYGLEEHYWFGIGVFDVNNLKYINDNLGHDKGDQYIVNMCKYICESFDHCPVFRIGGDEFVSIFVEISPDKVESCYKELLEKVDEYASVQDFNAGVAFGYSFFDKNNPKDVDELFKIADGNMYENKQKTKSK